MKQSSRNKAENIFLLCSISSVASILLITFFVLKSGLPGILEIGLLEFIFGKIWQPMAGIYGIFPMIIGSLAITLGAIAIAFPIGVLAAIYLSEIASARHAKLFRPIVQLLSAIPSVVYGFFGLMAIVPWINSIRGPGNSILASVLVLSLMILPSIISVSEVALRTVPLSYREASYALGETKISTIFRVTLPAAKRGIFTSLGLGAGRAIGEATAVILVSGNTVQIPGSIFDSVRTLTANCAIEMGYASGLHMEALFGTAIVLFVLIIVLNFVLAAVNRSSKGGA